MSVSEPPVATPTLPADVKEKIAELRTRYPTAEAVLLPALHLAQAAWDGWLPDEAIAAVAAELRKLGADVVEQPDGLILTPPRALPPARIATYDDHRMAMAFALAGLRAPGVTILDPGCVAKTYPRFWQDLEKLRGS